MRRLVLDSRLGPAQDCGMLEFEECPPLAELIRTNKAVGRTGKRFDGLGALSTVNNLRLLKRLVREYRPRHTLEIGLAFGGSALALLSELKAAHGDGFTHTAIDPFQSTVWDSVGVDLVSTAGFGDQFTLLPQFSKEALLQLGHRMFDLIYVDGSHLFEDVIVDVVFSADRLSDGGLLVLDDCTDPHVLKVVKFLRRNWRELFEELNVASTPKQRLAHMLNRSQVTVFRKTAVKSRPWNAPFHNF
jgi:predicted O-methyltransferase YrrM